MNRMYERRIPEQIPSERKRIGRPLKRWQQMKTERKNDDVKR